MKVQLSDEEIYTLAEIDIARLCTMVRERALMRELCKIEDEEINKVRMLIAECIDIDLEAVENEINTRACFHSFDGKLIVVRRRTFDLKLLFQEVKYLLELGFAGKYESILIVAKIILSFFVDFLDGDSEMIFSMLCTRYFLKGEAIHNIDIFEKINTFLKEEMGTEWSYKKINDVLRTLEKASVIEWDNGNLMVKDKIYF